MGSKSVRGAMAVAVLAMAAAGCSLSPSSAGSRFRCGSSDPCPDGTTCSAEGYCEIMGLADAGARDAAVTCGLLSDDFGDADIDLALWSVVQTHNSSAMQGSGELRLALDVSDQADVVEVHSNAEYAIAGGEVTVQVGSVPSGSAYLGFAVEYSDGERFAIRQRVGQTVVHWWPLGGDSSPEAIFSVANDEYRRWRIRSVDDTLRFDMAADSGVWVEVTDDPDRLPLPITVTLSLEDGAGRTTAALGSFQSIDSIVPCTDR